MHRPREAYQHRRSGVNWQFLSCNGREVGLPDTCRTESNCAAHATITLWPWTDSISASGPR